MTAQSQMLDRVINKCLKDYFKMNVLNDYIVSITIHSWEKKKSCFTDFCDFRKHFQRQNPIWVPKTLCLKHHRIAYDLFALENHLNPTGGSSMTKILMSKFAHEKFE